MSGDSSDAVAGGSSDVELLAALRRTYEAADPVPPDLAERALFALELEDLDTDFELLRLTEQVDALDGVRGRPADTTTISFGGPDMTIMVSIADLGSGRRRLDGWIAPGAAHRVEVRNRDGRTETTADRTGRFVLEDVASGFTRFIVHRGDQTDDTNDTDDRGAKPVVTPTVEL